MEDSCEYVLSKQSQRADKGLSSSFGVGRRATISSSQKKKKKHLVTKYYTRPRVWLAFVKFRVP
jgi:hypothetical protein